MLDKCFQMIIPKASSAYGSVKISKQPEPSTDYYLIYAMEKIHLKNLDTKGIKI